MSDCADPLGLIGTLIERKYLLQRVVAEGGFGVVYVARHIALDQPIAVKVLKPRNVGSDDWQELVSHFASEAQTVARLRHPNVVAVLDWGIAETERGSLPWMALEWLDGLTLHDDLLARRGLGGRSKEECLAILGPVMDAIAHAHAMGIAHRDIKPSNIMLVKSEQGFVPHVLDFGIAKVMAADRLVASSETTRGQGPRGYSLPYASPEQLAGTRTGPWTDVHALGLVLTEMLTDRPAYAGDDSEALHAAIFDARRPSPAAHGADVGDWEGVIARALALRAVDRFQNAGELAEALASTDPAGMTTSARIAGLVHRTGPGPSSSSYVQSTPRRVVALALAAVVAAASVAALVGPDLARSHGLVTARLAANVATARADASPPPIEYVARSIALPKGYVVSASTLTRDGRELAWTDATDLWIEPLDGGARRRIPLPSVVTPPPLTLHSLAGNEFLMSLGATERAVVLHADGSASVPVSLGGTIDGVSLDGSRVLLDSSRGLFETRLDQAGPARPVTTGPTWVAALEPTTEAIAWISTSGDQKDLVVASRNGLTRKLVTDGALLSIDGGVNVAWRGPHDLLFARQPASWAAPHQLIAIDPDRPDDAHPIFTWSEKFTIEQLSAMGERISFQKGTSRDGLRVVALPRRGPIAEPLGPRIEASPGAGSLLSRGAGWLPNGQLFFTTFEADERRTFVRDASGNARLVHTSPMPLASRAPPAVLESGEMLVWRQPPEGACELVRVRPDGGEAKVVRKADATLPCDTTVRCASHAPRCAAAIVDMGTVSLAWLDLVTQKVEVVHRRPATANFGFDVAPAGDVIAFVRGAGGLTLIDHSYSLREYPLVAGSDASLQTLRFAPDGRSLLISGMNVPGALYGILRADVDGRSEVVLKSANRWFAQPTPSPDGQSMVFYEREYENALCVLEPRRP